MIPSVTVSEDKNLLYSTSPGNSTTDQMFLLSITEMFKFNLSRCAPTAYAIAQGAKAIESYKVDGKPSCGWWLRSPGSDSFQAAYVTFAGLLRYSGASVCHVEGNFDNIPPAVRPALWVTLGS